MHRDLDVVDNGVIHGYMILQIHPDPDVMHENMSDMPNSNQQHMKSQDPWDAAMAMYAESVAWPTGSLTVNVCMHVWPRHASHRFVLTVHAESYECTSDLLPTSHMMCNASLLTATSNLVLQASSPCCL